MRTIHISITAPPSFIPLGSEGEHNATQVQFDLSEFRRWYGEGYAVLQMCRPMDKAPFPVYTRMEGDILLWDVCSVHTARTKASGYGICEVSYFVGDRLAKTTTIKTWAASSLGGSSPDTEPEAPWKENVLTAAGRAETAAQTAQSSATTAQAESGKAKASAEQSQESAQAASQSASDASAAAERSKQYQDGAQTAQNKAQTAATQAVNASTSSQTSAQAASQSASAAASAKTSAAASAAAAQAVLDGIPPDYTKTTEDVARLKSQKANIDGYYADMSVGFAENLISPDGVIDSSPFVFRTTAGGQSIADGYAELRSIKGNTVVWNQLAPRDGRFSRTNYGVTYTDNANGGIEVSGTAVGGTSYIATPIPVAEGHQYFLSSCPQGGSRDKYRAYCIGNVEQKNPDYGNGAIFWATESANTNLVPLRVEEGATVNFVIKPYLVDLTRLFGAGNEPLSLEDGRIRWLEEQLEKYPQYEEGNLLNVDVSGIKSTGFNLWDEEWELGGFAFADGRLIPQVDRIRNKNLIRVLSETNYYYLSKTGARIAVGYYDSNLNYLGYQDVAHNTVHKSPVDASYARFFVLETTYTNDVNVNFSWSGYRNGEYEPYWSQTRALPPIKEILGPDGQPLFPDGLMSAGAVRDEITAAKAIKRVGFSEESGLYELEIPIEVEFAEPYNFTYKISDFGTEEFISSGRTAPVCHETLYMRNLRDDVRRLPSDYQSQDSMNNLLSALGQAMGVSITAVWDKEEKEYRYTVTSNERRYEGDMDGD